MTTKNARITQIAAALKTLGAGTAIDLAGHLHTSAATVRHYMPALIASGQAVLITPGQKLVAALYGPPDIDDELEFDLHHVTVADWAPGQASRMDLVAALFGAPGTIVTISPPCAMFAPRAVEVHS